MTSIQFCPNAETPKFPEPQNCSENGSTSFRCQVNFRGHNYNIEGIPINTTILQLQLRIEELTEIPVEFQKLIAPKIGILRLPNDILNQLNNSDQRGLNISNDDMVSSGKPVKDTSPLVYELLEPGNRKLKLFGTTPKDIKSLHKTQMLYRMRHRRRLFRPGRHHPFSVLRSVALPDEETTEAAQTFLESLASDPQISRGLIRLNIRVGLLTEIDPAENPTNQLGMNEGRGKVIRLVLRNSEADGGGFRDYQYVKDVLCHQLAHCVSDSHDSEFWAALRIIKPDSYGVDRAASDCKAFSATRELIDAGGVLHGVPCSALQSSVGDTAPKTAPKTAAAQPSGTEPEKEDEKVGQNGKVVERRDD